MKTFAKFLFFIFAAIAFSSCKSSVNQAFDYNNSILWPFMGCQANEFMEKHDSIATAVNKALCKDGVLLPVTDIKKVVARFEPEVDDVFLFVDSLSNFDHVHIYGKRNVFCSKNNSDIEYIVAAGAPFFPQCNAKEKIEIKLHIRNCPYHKLLSPTHFKKYPLGNSHLVFPGAEHIKNGENYGL